MYVIAWIGILLELIEGVIVLVSEVTGQLKDAVKDTGISEQIKVVHTKVDGPGLWVFDLFECCCCC